MNLKKFKPLGGGVHQLNNSQLFNLQLFADTPNYSKVDNPYEFYLNKPTYTKGDIKKVYSLKKYASNHIPNYNTITTLPEENANYIKEALPNVTSCYNMLHDCNALTSIDTTGWDIGNVIDMGDMFSYCYKLTTIDASKWNTSNVTNMDSMFWYCHKLTSLDASNWDTSNVTNMSNMFYYCDSLATLDISNWDTSKVTDMTNMFYGCNNLTTIKGVIDMKSCASYDNMFTYCYKLTGVKIKNPPSGITVTSGIGGLKAGKYEIVS